MFNPRSGAKPPKEEQQGPAQPRDALSALMDGDTPDDKSLRFPNEHSNSWRASPTSKAKPTRPSSGMEDYHPDYHYNSKPNESMGEFRPAKQSSTMESKLSS